MSDEQQPFHSANSPTPGQTPQDDFRIVPASHGVLWIKRGITLFRISPTIWMASSLIIIFTLFFLILTMMVLPLLFPLYFIATSFFVGGLMIGCRRLHQHQKFDVACLFAGFEQFTAKLTIVGIYYFLGTMISYLLALALARQMGFEIHPVDLNLLASDQEEMRKFVESLLMPMLLMMLFMVPVLMAFWFAPALVIFFDIKPINAFKKSFLACTYNTIPFLIFGLVALFAVILISTIIGAISALVPVLGFIMNFVFQLVLVSLTIATIYTAFDDIFPSFAAQSSTPPEQPVDHLVA